MHEDNPDSRSFEMLMEAMYENHPIRVPILGSKESIARITPEDLYTCHKAFYRPGNMMLCVIGDVDPEKVCQAAENILPATDLVSVSRQEDWPELPTPSCTRTGGKMEVAMTMFQLGFKHENLGNGFEAIRQEAIGDLAAEALFGESSPLYLRLYEEGIIDGSFGGGFETVDGMSLLIVSGDSNEPEKVRDSILEQAAVLAQTGIEEKDFLRMKRSAMGRRIRDLDSFDSVCFRLCAYHLSQYDYFRFPDIYRSIASSDIQDFIKRVVTPHNCSLCVVVPAQEEAET